MLEAVLRGVDRHGVDRHGVDRHGVDRHGVDRHGVDRLEAPATALRNSNLHLGKSNLHLASGTAPFQMTRGNVQTPRTFRALAIRSASPTARYQDAVLFEGQDRPGDHDTDAAHLFHTAHRPCRSGPRRRL
ncbi:hypothetical protein FLX07_27180 [Microbispora bryophytorum]|nr:hypothetical protein FLX07_27180 [Microbispora bryophytorum]